MTNAGATPPNDDPIVLQQTLPLPATSPTSAPSDLWWILGAVRRNIWLVIAVMAVVSVLTAVLAFRSQPTYQAWALMRLQDARAPLTHGLIDPMEAQGRSTTDPMLSEVSVLTSRSVAAKVLQHPGALPLRLYTSGFELAALDSVSLAPRETQDSLRLTFEDDGLTVRGSEQVRRVRYGMPVELDGVRFTVSSPRDAESGWLVVVPEAAAVDSLLDVLEVLPRARTDLLDVGFTANDPDVAVGIVNAVAEVFRNVSSDAAREQASRRREFLEEQLHHNDSVLTMAQVAISQLRANNQAYSSQDMFAASQAGMADLDLQRVELEVEYRSYQSLLDNLTSEAVRGANARSGIASLSASAASNPVVSQLYTQLLRQQAVYDSLTTGEYRSAENSPDVRRQAALIQSSREQLVEAVRSHANAIGARLAALGGIASARAAGFRRMPAAEVEEARLAMQLEALTQVGDQLRSEYQRTLIDEAVDAGTLSIIDFATPPRSALGTGPALKIGLGAMLGLMLGGGAAVLREVRNTAIRRREDIEDAMQLPWLAIIPRIRPASRPDSRVFSGKRATDNQNRLTRFFRDERSLLVERAYAADAFRNLQVNMVLARDQEAPRVIAVTSAVAQDGKTTTAINLAVAYAEQGSRVLLMDCDLRRPHLHRLSNMQRSPGIADVVLGGQAAEDVIRVISTNLWLMPAGSATPSPPALLSSVRMREIVESLVGSFDVIVMDCPPALLAADAALAGSLADGVLFVVRAGHTDRALAMEALDQLRRLGIRILGAALNDPSSVTPRGTYEMYGEYAEHHLINDGLQRPAAHHASTSDGTD